jgi:hypothetical protein
VDPVPVSVDIPDENRLGDKLPNMDDGPRVDRPQATLELRDRGGTVVEQGLGERCEDAVVGWIDHQNGFHPFPVRSKGKSPRNPNGDAVSVAGLRLACALQTPELVRGA